MNLFTLIIESAKEEPIIWRLLASGLGAFFGALFAYIFFKQGEKWKKKMKWKNTYLLEHAYLERYLYDLHITLIDNKRMLGVIVESYGRKEINMFDLSDLPIRESASMRIDDILFINKLELYAGNDLKRLNRWQIGINKVKDKINENLASNDEGKRKGAEKSIEFFIKETKDLIKKYNYHLDATDELIIENRVLLKKYKKWKYKKDKMKNTFEERKKEIEEEGSTKEEVVTDNPIKEDYIARLKKFELYNEE